MYKEIKLAEAQAALNNKQEKDGTWLVKICLNLLSGFDIKYKVKERYQRSM